MGTKRATEVEAGDTIVRNGQKWNVSAVADVSPDDRITFVVRDVGGPDEEIRFDYGPEDDVEVA